jgi:hypothetical protein
MRSLNCLRFGAVEVHIGDLLLARRRVSSVGIRQERRPAVLRARPALTPLLTLPCRAMSHYIRAVTVGALEQTSPKLTLLVNSKTPWMATLHPTVEG